MKKIIFLLICCCVNFNFNVNAQWRKEYIPGDELREIPSEWSYRYDIGDKSITFTESTGMLLIVAKKQFFLANDDGGVPVLIGMYKNGKLIEKENFIFTITPDKHACGLVGFKEHLKSIITNGTVIRIVAPLHDDFDFDITTTKMPEKFGSTQRSLVMGA